MWLMRRCPSVTDIKPPLLPNSELLPNSDPIAPSQPFHPETGSQASSEMTDEMTEGWGSELGEPVVQAYFTSFNAANFAQAAGLFAETGRLLPPFEAPIVSPSSIAAYLDREAQGMQALPRQVTAQTFPAGNRQVNVVGQVQMPLFTVKVQWEFVIDRQDAILSLRIRLLAALKDLLHLKPAPDSKLQAQD